MYQDRCYKLVVYEQPRQEVHVASLVGRVGTVEHV